MKTRKTKTEKPDPFADILQVRRICSGDAELVKKEEPKAGKSTKTDKRYITTNLADYERRRPESNIDKTGLKYFLPGKKSVTKMNGLSEKINIPRQLKRGQLASEIKMIPVNLPRFGRGEAIIHTNINEEYAYGNKVSAAMQDKIPEEFIDTFNYEQPSNLLEDAKKEIDISQNQLQKIQTILKNRNAEESYSLKPKWSAIPPKYTTKINSKERVVSTLTTLNKKLNDMQEKYFSGTKNSYKSIKDFSSKMRSESTSEVDITESGSDFNIQIQDKDEILEKFDLSRIKRFQNLISEEKGTSVGDNMDEPLSNSGSKVFKVPTEKKAMLNVTESNSDGILPTEAKNRILEKFHLTRIQRMCDNIIESENINKSGKLLSDKGQYYATTVPDIILREDTSMSGLAQLAERQSMYDPSLEIYNDTSEENLVRSSVIDINSEDVPIGNIAEIAGKLNFAEKDVEELRELLLTQDQKSLEKMEDKKSLSFLKQKDNESLLNDSTSFDFKKLNPKKSEVDPLKSRSSETHYFDCDSKSATPCLTSTTSNKKIFYDNFGRYSSSIRKWDQNNNIEANSVPNLTSSRFVASETMTSSDKEVFNNTPLQDAVLQSDYLTKSFTIDSSGSFSENQSNQISKNKSDQFFNGGLDFKSLESKSIKGPKTTKDMYLTLTKALSNSFYELPPQN